MNQYFIEVLQEKDFSMDDVFVEIKKDFPSLNVKNIEPLLTHLVKVRVRGTALSYHTIDPNGKAVISSGVILRPINRKPRGVIHFLPSANIDKFGSGSDALLIFEGLLSFFGYTIVIADLLGNGVTKDTIEYPFCLSDNTGQVAYDMQRAAMEYFTTVLGKPMQKHISIGGYSLGGSSALALLRHIERVNPSDIIVDRAIIGGGIYDLPTAMKVFRQTGYAQYPATPGIIFAYNKWYNLNLDFSKIFIDPLLTNMYDWLNRTYDRFVLIERIGQDMHKYMHPDFFTEEGNSEFQKLMPFLKANSLVEGWTPRTRLRMSHASDDESVPTAVARYAYQSFKERGARVNMHYGTGGHYDFGKWYFLNFIKHLILKRFAIWTRH